MHSRPHIALIEDNADSRLLVEVLLETDFEVRSYEDGLTALEGLQRHPPDLVLLDISLPGLSGPEVLERLRSLPATTSVPVVALTAHAMHGDRERLLAVGFDGYVSKPLVDGNVLFSAIAANIRVH